MAFCYFRRNAVAVLLALLVNASTSETDLVAFMSSSIPTLLTDVPKMVELAHSGKMRGKPVVVADEEVIAKEQGVVVA
jgi:hypothetical protein